MPQGHSLHIGLNSVDPAHYGGWSGPLVACEADANDMEAIASGRGFTTQTLLTSAATRDAVKAAIAAAAGQLGAGDIFLLTNSSHGGQLPDKNGDESDGYDETLCFYDGQFVDDELYLALADFAAGVRVVVTSDSCHSGSVTKSPELRAIYGDMLSIPTAPMSFPGIADGGLPRERAAPRPVNAFEVRPRAMPLEVQASTYLRNRDFYDPILTAPELKDAERRVKASALLLAGCQDNQTSMDGAFNGAFTGQLKTVWNGGNFKGGYRGFLSKIRRQLPASQSPNFYPFGARDADFETRQQPFLIEEP